MCVSIQTTFEPLEVDKATSFRTQNEPEQEHRDSESQRQNDKLNTSEIRYSKPPERSSQKRHQTHQTRRAETKDTALAIRIKFANKANRQSFKPLVHLRITAGHRRTRLHEPQPQPSQSRSNQTTFHFFSSLAYIYMEPAGETLIAHPQPCRLRRLYQGLAE